MPTNDRAALYQSLAASAAAVVAFHGILHEVVGPQLFPWAPDTFGFALWHGLGIGVLALGLLVWAGAVGLMRFPVVAASIAIACLGIGAVIFMAVTHSQFHFFALCLAIAAAVTAFCHRHAEEARGMPAFI